MQRQMDSRSNYADRNRECGHDAEENCSYLVVKGENEKAGGYGKRGFGPRHDCNRVMLQRDQRVIEIDLDKERPEQHRRDEDEQAGQHRSVRRSGLFETANFA